MTNATPNTAHPSCPCSQPRGQSRQASTFQILLSQFSLARSRAHLKNLDQAQLSDIGISREAAEKEAARSLWDVPSHWQK